MMERDAKDLSDRSQVVPPHPGLIPSLATAAGQLASGQLKTAGRLTKSPPV